MERFHPSQIDWTGFVNRGPTSISQLWPPSNSSESRETTPDRSTLPTSTNTVGSDWQTVTDPSDVSLASPELDPDHVRSIESLRSFVKKEIGLNAIDNRMSQPIFRETAPSSWTNVDPDPVNLEYWTKQQVNRVNRSLPDVNTQVDHNISTFVNQPIAIKPTTKHGRMSRLKEKCLNHRDSLKTASEAMVGKIQTCFCKLTSRT